MQIRQKISCAQGFTLIELLAALAVIGILSAILIPIGRNVMIIGRSSKDAANLRSIALANQAYANDNQQRCVVAFTSEPDPITQLSKTWHTDLRPYIDKQTTERRGVVEAFISPSDPSHGGLTNSVLPLASDDWRRRSYSINHYTRRYIPGSGNRYEGRFLPELPTSSMIFVGNHRATEIETHAILPNSPLSLEMIPRDWHSQKDYAQFAFLDGHVAMIRVDDLLPGGERYETAWGPIPTP